MLTTLMYVSERRCLFAFFFFFQAEDGIRDWSVTGVQTCALPISPGAHGAAAGEVFRVATGERHEFAAQAGNRLRCGASATAMVVGPFGTLTAAPRTDLEVQSMEWTVKNGAVAAGALTLAVVAGSVTWHSLARAEQATAGET